MCVYILYIYISTMGFVIPPPYWQCFQIHPLISPSHGFVSDEELERLPGLNRMCDPWQLPSSTTCLSAWTSCCVVMIGKGAPLSNLRTLWHRHVQMTWSWTIVGLGQWCDSSRIGCLPNSISLMFSFVFTRSSWTSSWYLWRKGMMFRV